MQAQQIIAAAQQRPDGPVGLLQLTPGHQAGGPLNGRPHNQHVLQVGLGGQGKPLLRHVGQGITLLKGLHDPELDTAALEGQGVFSQISGVVPVVGHAAHFHGDQVGSGDPPPNQNQGPRKHPQQRGAGAEKNRQGQGGQQQIGQPAPQMVQAVRGALLGGRGHEALPPGAGNVVGAQLPAAVQLHQQHPPDAEGQRPVAGEQAAHQVPPLMDHDLEDIGQNQQRQQGQKPRKAQGVHLTHAPVAHRTAHQGGQQSQSDGFPGNLFFLSHRQFLHKNTMRPDGGIGPYKLSLVGPRALTGPQSGRVGLTAAPAAKRFLIALCSHFVAQFPVASAVR